MEAQLETKKGVRHAPLAMPQIVRLSIVGVVIWFVVALLLQWAGGLGAYEGTGRIIMYALIALGTPALLLTLMPLAGIKRNQIVLGTVVVLAVASLCDGLALAWFPAPYGGGDMVAGAGGTILWGVGLACGLSFVINREVRS